MNIWQSFQSKKLPICTRIVIFNLCICLPIWGFADYFAWNNSCEPSQHLTVTSEGSFFAVIFSLLVHNSEFLENLIKNIIVSQCILMWSRAEWVNWVTLQCINFILCVSNDSSKSLTMSRDVILLKPVCTQMSALCAKRAMHTRPRSYHLKGSTVIPTMYIVDVQAVGCNYERIWILRPPPPPPFVSHKFALKSLWCPWILK